MSAIGVIGAGAWGTALAHALARGGHSVSLWARERETAAAVTLRHENPRYLPGFPLSPALDAVTDIAAAASGKDFVILASPSLYVADTARRIAGAPGVADGAACIGVLAKGFIGSPAGPRLILDVLEEALPAPYRRSLVYISGPSHAEEVVQGKLTGLIAASENPKNSIRFRDLLRVRGILAYASFDTVGVQVCAAAKNVIAVVYGAMDAIAEGSAGFFGDNARSLLLAAGLNEIQTIGFALGATHPETFTSISGVGDLDVTCRSRYGRNRRFGRDIILTDILSRFSGIDGLIARIGDIGYLPEGAVACKFIHSIAVSKALRLPICGGLYRILNKECAPRDMLAALIGEL